MSTTIDKIAAKIDNLKLPSFGVKNLKDLIRAVRNCKTQADERAVIAKESAAIRTMFKEENTDFRAVNVAKLLYIHMLGYPAHFGQMECLKLVASPRFGDKRLGYLGIMLLLDENQEVLTLVTNSLQNDMKHSNMFIVGLALATLGNISSVEMARDLEDDVAKLLGSTNSYIRKKAALCALRIIRKVPDLVESFLDRSKALLNEKNHGVLLTGVTLLTEIVKLAPPEITSSLKRELVPALVKHLKNLISAGFSPEHDVSGICDPFLQIKILKLMRLFGRGDKEISETMNDVLAQVATNTESSKNVGNAILYEAVLTIMDIESESSLRVLAINILGKFLANKDNNIRYVALTTLCRTCAESTSSSDSSALQRHRATVLDCLRDADISIRRRALDLSFFLVNGQNIRLLTRELLSYLEVTESDAKASVSQRICDAASKHRPNKRWEIDTVLRVLKVAGAYVTQDVINHFVKLVSTAPPELQQYTVRKLFNLVKAEGDKALTQEGLVIALMWCVGEFGDLLVRGNSATGKLFDEGDDDKPEGELQVAPTEKEVVDSIDSLLRGPYSTSNIKEYVITALAKLTSRFTDDAVVAKVKVLVDKYKSNVAVELQQRSVEYGQMFTLDKATRDGVFEKMPPLDSAVKEEKEKQNRATNAPVATTEKSAPNKTGSLLGGLGDDLLSLNLGSTATTAAASANPTDVLAGLFGAPAAPVSTQAKVNNVLDLLGGLGTGTTAAPAPSLPTQSTSAANVLGNLFGTTPLAPTSPAPSTVPKPAADPLADLLGGALSTPAPPLASIPVSSATPSLVPVVSASQPSPALIPSVPVAAPVTPASTQKTYTAYEKNGLLITFNATREAHPTENVVNTVTITFKNNNVVGNIENINFQVAVPKSMKLIMQPPSSNVVAPNATATQMMKIANPAKAPLKLRLKVMYSANGSPVDEIVDFSGFDQSLWA